MARLGIQIAPHNAVPQHVDGFVHHAEQALKVLRIGNLLWAVLEVLRADGLAALPHGADVAPKERGPGAVQAAVGAKDGGALRHSIVVLLVATRV